MKKIVLLILCLLHFAFNGFSQMNDSVSSKVAPTVVSMVRLPSDSNQFIKVEIEASFPGGLSAWAQYLGQNLYGNIANDNHAPLGTYHVLIEFLVDRDGTITGIRPLTSCGYGMEEEAMRVIRNSPKWLPASVNGDVVKAIRQQPVTFKVEK